MSLEVRFEISKHCAILSLSPPTVWVSVTTRVSRVTIHVRPEGTHVQHDSLWDVGSKLLGSDTRKFIVGIFKYNTIWGQGSWCNTIPYA